MIHLSVFHYLFTVHLCALGIASSPVGAHVVRVYCSEGDEGTFWPLGSANETFFALGLISEETSKPQASKQEE